MFTIRFSEDTELVVTPEELQFALEAFYNWTVEINATRSVRVSFTMRRITRSSVRSDDNFILEHEKARYLET